MNLVPTDDVPVHQLQVVDSKRLKISARTIDRTACEVRLAVLLRIASVSLERLTEKSTTVQSTHRGERFALLEPESHTYRLTTCLRE